MLLQMALFHSFLYMFYILHIILYILYIVYMYHIFIHSSVDSHLGSQLLLSWTKPDKSFSKYSKVFEITITHEQFYLINI